MLVSPVPGTHLAYLKFILPAQALSKMVESIFKKKPVDNILPTEVPAGQPWTCKEARQEVGGWGQDFRIWLKWLSVLLPLATRGQLAPFPAFS